MQISYWMLVRLENLETERICSAIYLRAFKGACNGNRGEVLDAFA
jgi:hypothetical protein